ncbi:golvesin C-terminal-like domain-containing protein [Pyxidicoccus xibeiensis]|uniref:golvesin C-terminal-like domain-containing protein n=1 Tax=Pyxidicoccus xibeiensis TaxID=2906759 RepID=UPI0020A734B9|nr:N-acetylmuramoyl-L-alanine amidase [Pyxidicoccus xibeiensis]MCP3136767.1 N-acetylmuramoyl-L-alanine amidase [Pyxidicoccus xibeiensis]
MHPFRKPLATLTAALSLVACGPQESPPPETPAAVEDSRTPAQREAERTPYALDEAFAQAAREFDVPVDLLKAYAYAETRWEMVKGHEEFPGLSPAHGLMALRGSQVSEGARLTGRTEEAVRTEPEANIRAAAALLSAYADELQVDRSDVGAWAPAAVKLSGISNPDAQTQFVHQSVYSVMREGAVAHTPDGQVAVSLSPAEVEARFASPGVQAMAAGPDYAASIWRPSSNYNARPAGTDISMVVIHTCEGGYSGCWSWQVNPDSDVSAHYTVNESGSEITQLLRETDRGWHVAASYDCTLNGNVSCGLNGSSVNNFSVGIEHAGYASQSSFPAGQIDASAKLTCDITRDRTVVRDSYHIVAHGRLQPYNRTDPGPNWPWTTYINKVKSYCGDTTSSTIIDSNNANNDTSKYYVELAGTSWVSSTNVGGYYGSGYYVAPTAAVSEPVTFWFNLPAAATKTVDGWWTSATDRSTEAPFNVFNASGTKLGTVYVNQQTGGGNWNTLGTFNFSAGWNKVQVSRWTGAAGYVVADAVRIR